MQDFIVVYGPVLLILAVACVGCSCESWASFWSSKWDHWDDLDMFLSQG